MNNFYNARINCGYTQKEVADLLEISRQAYGSYETEIRQPDPSTLIKLAKVFNTTIDYLLGVDNSLQQNNTALIKKAEIEEAATIGERIKALRKSNNLTQTEFGKLFGIGKTTVSSYETGNSCPNDSIKLAICRFFNVTTDYLLGNSNEKTPFTVTEEDVKAALFNGSKDVTPEMWEEVKDFAKYVQFKYSE